MSTISFKEFENKYKRFVHRHIMIDLEYSGGKLEVMKTPTAKGGKVRYKSHSGVHGYDSELEWKIEEGVTHQRFRSYKDRYMSAHHDFAQQSPASDVHGEVVGPDEKTGWEKWSEWTELIQE